MDAHHKQECINELHRLIELIERHAPSILIAHRLVAVTTPKIARLVGINNYMEQVCQQQGRTLAKSLGICTCCLEKYSLPDDSVCGECQKQVKEFGLLLDGDQE